MSDDKKKRILDLLASAAGIEDPVEQSRKYRNIAGSLSFEAVRSNDTWYLEEAIKTAHLVTVDTSQAYVDIVRAMAKMGTNKKDEKILHKATELIALIDNPLSISVGLHELVTPFAKLGIDKNDEQLLSHALELSEKIPLNTYRSSALRNLSRSLAAIYPGKAQELLDTAIELIENSEDIEPVFRISAYCDIASLLALFNDDRSNKFIKRSISLADKIEDDFERSAVLLKIVEIETAIGNKKKDNILMNEAQSISKGITKEYYKTLAQIAIGAAGTSI